MLILLMGFSTYYIMSIGKNSTSEVCPSAIVPTTFITTTTTLTFPTIHQNNVELSRNISRFPKFIRFAVIAIGSVIFVSLVSLLPMVMYFRRRKRTVKWKPNDLSQRQREFDIIHNYVDREGVGTSSPSSLQVLPSLSPCNSSEALSGVFPNGLSNSSLAETSGPPHDVCFVEIHPLEPSIESSATFTSEPMPEGAPSSSIMIPSTGNVASSSVETLVSNTQLQQDPPASIHTAEATPTPVENAEFLQTPEHNNSRVVPGDLALKRQSGVSSSVTSPLHSGLYMKSPESFTRNRSNPGQSADTLVLLQPTEDYQDDTNNFVFLGSTQVIVCDSKGGKYEVLEQGITVRIPPNALDTEAHIEVGVTIHGSFKFPTGQQPISAIVWLLVRGTSTFTFKKPVEIQLPHFLNLSNSDIDEKAEEFGLGFMTTNEEMDRRQQLIFTEGPRESVVYLQRSAKVLMKHFCFVCLSAKDSVIYERSKYLLTQVLPDPIKTLQWDLHFCVSYNLESFAKV